MANLRNVAREAKNAVNKQFDYYLRANGYNPDDMGYADIPEELMDHELYLHVYPDGSWVIDHAQYLTDGRTITCAPLCHYRTINELYDSLQQYRSDCW